jgi:hypothetical protein
LNWLQDNFSMENWYINFTPTGNGSGFNVSATIDFWLEGTPPFIWTWSPADHLIVRDTDNNIMTWEDIDWLFSGDMICNMWEWYYCEFTVNHFTSFELYIPPFDCDNVTDVSVEECEALVDLYNETNGPDRGMWVGMSLLWWWRRK